MNSTKTSELVCMSPSSFRNKNIKGSMIQDVLAPHCCILWQPWRRHEDAINPYISMLAAQLLKRHKQCCQRSWVNLHHPSFIIQGNTLERGGKDDCSQNQSVPTEPKHNFWFGRANKQLTYSHPCLQEFGSVSKGERQTSTHHASLYGC